MAYIRKLPSGNWQAQVQHPSGKRTTKTDPLKRVVAAWAASMEAGFRTGALTPEAGRRVTVAAWCARWVQARGVEPISARRDRSHLDVHVLPYWGAWPLQTIGRLDVQTWIRSMTRAGAGAPTVVGAYHLLSAMLADAALEGVIAGSPCQKIDLPRIVKPTPRWLTRDEYDRIQLAIAESVLTRRGGGSVPDPHRHVWAAYVALGCFSGLRPGELAGLDIPSLDLDRDLVRVSQVMTREGLRAYPKSASSQRTVPFPAEVRELLWRVCADRSQGPVLPAPGGGRISETNFRSRVWTRTLAAAGVEYERPYVMRHTCASWLVQAGVPDRQIMRILGHSSTALVSTYAHLSPHAHDDVRAAWATRQPTLSQRSQPPPAVSGPTVATGVRAGQR